jgi:hypothetical protein
VSRDSAVSRRSRSNSPPTRKPPAAGVTDVTWTMTVRANPFAGLVRPTARSDPTSTRRSSNRPTPFIETSLRRAGPGSATTGRANEQDALRLTANRSAARLSVAVAIGHPVNLSHRHARSGRLPQRAWPRVRPLARSRWRSRDDRVGGSHVGAWQVGRRRDASRPPERAERTPPNAARQRPTALPRAFRPRSGAHRRGIGQTRGAFSRPALAFGSGLRRTRSDAR